MKVTKRSPLTGLINTMELDVTQDQLDAYKYRKGLVQDIFPRLSASEREFIMTGYTAEDWAKIFPPEEDLERESHEQAVAAGASWRDKWPNHCKQCHGWGGFSFYQSHGPGPSEQMFDTCDAYDNFHRCHRCGELGLTADGDGPCSHCGWNYDDGDPSP